MDRLKGQARPGLFTDELFDFINLGNSILAGAIDLYSTDIGNRNVLFI